MAANFGLRSTLYKHVRCLTGAARRTRAWVGHATITDVVRQILTDENIDRIVNKLIGFTIGESASVDRF